MENKKSLIRVEGTVNAANIYEGPKAKKVIVSLSNDNVDEMILSLNYGETEKDPFPYTEKEMTDKFIGKKVTFLVEIEG